VLLTQNVYDTIILSMITVQYIVKPNDVSIAKFGYFHDMLSVIYMSVCDVSVL